MADDAHDGEFWLPVTSLVHYDDPSVGLGDEAWDPEALRASMVAEGQAREIEVGTSLHDVATRGDDAVACFNGNHRLREARRLGWRMIRCVNSEADDAGPLTAARILAMGGSLEDPNRGADPTRRTEPAGEAMGDPMTGNERDADDEASSGRRGSIRAGVPLALRTPCRNCPFRTDVAPYLTRERATLIADATFREGRPFNCHRTIAFDEDTGEGLIKATSQNCAGALILAERIGRRGQIAQIAERLGLWSPDRLDMDAPVHETVEAFVSAFPPSSPDAGRRRRQPSEAVADPGDEPG